MPRKPIGKRPMSDAERARRYRANRAKAVKTGRLAGVDERWAEKLSTMALIDTIRDCVTRCDRENGLRLLPVLGRRLMELEEAPYPSEDD